MRQIKNPNETVVDVSNYLTVRQASKISDRSEAALRKRIQDGKLCFIKVGHAVLIPKEQVEKLKNKDLVQEVEEVDRVF